MGEFNNNDGDGHDPFAAGKASGEGGSAADESRRAFIRKTAEGAALSLFGVMGLDAVAEKILARLEERSATRALAGAVGDLLHEAGIGAMAFAAEGCSCPWDNDFTCRDPAQPFECPLPNGDPFECTQVQGFQCNPFHFLCDVVNNQGPAFQCPGTAEQFRCGGTQNPATFYCQAGYLCPNVVQFAYAPCGPGSWDCAPASRFAETCSDTLVQCPIAGGPFMCPGDTIYRCGFPGDPDAEPLEPPAGEFFCPTDKFTCNGGTLFDFQCPCAFDCEGHFDCGANHIFLCGGSSQTSDFDCAPEGYFTCAAGGNQCNQPGTGGYALGDPRPGDFTCVGGTGAANNFQCTHPFTCSTVDDFTCAGATGGADFVCDAGQFLCEPQLAGNFNCHEGVPAVAEFVCSPSGGQTFQCQPQEVYDPDW